jgi:hypothetical protein
MVVFFRNISKFLRKADAFDIGSDQVRHIAAHSPVLEYRDYAGYKKNYRYRTKTEEKLALQ